MEEIEADNLINGAEETEEADVETDFAMLLLANDKIRSSYQLMATCSYYSVWDKRKIQDLSY